MKCHSIFSRFDFLEKPSRRISATPLSATICQHKWSSIKQTNHESLLKMLHQETVNIDECFEFSIQSDHRRSYYTREKSSLPSHSISEVFCLLSWKQKSIQLMEFLQLKRPMWLFFVADAWTARKTDVLNDHDQKNRFIIFFMAEILRKFIHFLIRICIVGAGRSWCSGCDG